MVRPRTVRATKMLLGKGLTLLLLATDVLALSLDIPLGQAQLVWIAGLLSS